MKASTTPKKKRVDVIWKGYPESYTDADLRAFGEMIKGCKDMREAEFMFGARNHKDAIIITMTMEGNFEKYVRPYPIELFEHKYEAYSKLIGREQFIEKKKLEGLTEIAEQMTVPKIISEEEIVNSF